jgi:isoleucyl-tRNA synthetase
VTVNPEFTYLKIEVEGKKLIIAECRVSSLYKSESQYKILEKFTGK